MTNGLRGDERRLKVGVQLPEVERNISWPELRAIATTADDIGLDSVWVGDHLLYREPFPQPRGPWEAWSTLAALAEATSRVELGPLVACTAFHNPAILAKKAATIDEISSGRLILGLGAGWNRDEFDAYGFPYDHRASRFEESFTVIREMLRHGRVDFRGRFVSAPECVLVPRGPRASGPPLMIGTARPRMLRIAATHADIVHTWYSTFGNHPDGIPALQKRIDTACRDVGRDPSHLQRSLALLVQFPGGVGREMGHSASRKMDPVPRGHLVDTLRSLAAQGICHVQLVCDPIDVRSVESVGPLLEQLDAPL